MLYFDSKYIKDNATYKDKISWSEGILGGGGKLVATFWHDYHPCGNIPQ